MGLKVTLETLDDVQTEYQSLYVERDGAFVLDVEGVDNHPEVRNLKTAYTAEKAKRAETSDKLRDALAKLEAKPEPTAKDDAEMIRLREALEADRDGWKTKAETFERQVYGLTVESQLDAAIREVGISEPAFQKAAKRLLSEGVKLHEGRPIVETDMGPVGLVDHVKRWAAGEGKAFVSPASGGGASGNKGGGGGGKTIAASELATMTSAEKAKFYKANPGVKVTE